MQCKSDDKKDSLAAKNISTSIVVEIENVKTSESAENFQKFMYESFEKNGVLHDLRAYLRGHIVGVLRSAQTGDTLSCQKHFTKRLELPIQALNILIAEYLLRLEFSYSLSVFLSEIPLANMVFAFAKSLMQNANCDADLRFKDKDVWSILNCIGIKCDSDHASDVVDMYRRDKHAPLLLCILKCMSLYTEPAGFVKGSSQESISSSGKSVENLDISYSHRPTTSKDKCKHSAFCKTCRSKILEVKQKYNRKKKAMVKILKDSNLRSHNVDSLMKNIDVLERNVLDEMFQQLESVYEAETKMIKTEEQKRLKIAVATHAAQLEKKRIEMEEQFQAREAELERNVRQKKRFLWGLARLLRDQHSHMSRAMTDVQAETGRLSEKENSLKTQLAEAEKVLRQRGEDMRDQISQELVILEAHLESMKKERNSINKERSELESMRNVNTTNIESSKGNLCSHYDLLKTEFTILKKYLETAKLEPKCVLERSTMTEFEDTLRNDVMNNENDEKTSNEAKLKVKHVVNDLKKPKNVNFSQVVVSSNLDEVYHSQSRSSRSTFSSTGVVGPECRDRDQALRDLADENQRLRTFARQQGSHIDSLSIQQARLQAELTAARSPLTAVPAGRPRTAPTTPHNDGRSMFTQRLNSSVINLSNGWRKGAGEELSFLSNAQPRIVVPGDTLPFIGVVRDRHNENRRYLINQWRSLRRRGSPPGGVGKRARDRLSSAGPNLRLPPREDLNNNENAQPTNDDGIGNPREIYKFVMVAEAKPRDQEKIPKSVLKEDKNKLRTKDYTTSTPVAREKSPNTILRDAKLRLRKLEIEAEAVEQSYLDFRRRRESTRGEGRLATDGGVSTSKYDGTLTGLIANEDESRRNQSISHHNPPQTPAMPELDKYIKQYHAKYDIGETNFKNKNVSSTKAKPVPNFADYEIPSKEEKQDYLETPIVEFRKYYHSEKRVLFERREDKTPVNVENIESVSKPGSIDSKNHPKSKTKRNDISENINQKDSRSSKSDKSRSLHSKVRPKFSKTKKVHPYTSDSVPVSPRSTDIRNGPNSPNPNSERLGNDESENKQEIKMLINNINKTYDLGETIIAENNFGGPLDVQLLINNENNVAEETDISKHDIGNAKDPMEDRNILRIELESVAQVNDVKITESQTQDLLLLVESSANEKGSDIDYRQEITQMTILVSPKRSDVVNEPAYAVSPAKSQNSELDEKSVNIDNDILNSIYQADPNDNISSVHVQLEQSKDTLENTISELEANPNYPDDFSADVDNLNSVHSCDTYFGNRSPISMPNTSENDNFWD